MATTRASIANLMTVEIDRILQEVWPSSSHKRILDLLFNTETSNKRYEYDLTVGGFPLLAEKPEGENLEEYNFHEGYKTTYEPRTFGCIVPVTMEAQQDELHSALKKIPASIQRAADAVLSYYMSRIFSRATSTDEDFITGGDGVALLSTAHPLAVSGGTTSNTPSSAVDLTLTSLWAGVNSFFEMLDDAGKPLAIPPRFLLVPHQSQQKALELLLSKQYPESAENAINALQSAKAANMEALRLEPVVWPYWLGSVDSDCWFLLADKSSTPDYPLRFIWRMKPETDSYNDFFSKDFLYSMVFRFACGYSDPRFCYGSMGA